MDARPDIVKGAVFSYSIQHGQWTAAGAVKAAGIKNSTTDEQFLQKLYAYRKKHIRRIPRVTTKNFPLHYLYCKKTAVRRREHIFELTIAFLLRSRFFPVIMNWISVTLV